MPQLSNKPFQWTDPRPCFRAAAEFQRPGSAAERRDVILCSTCAREALEPRGAPGPRYRFSSPTRGVYYRSWFGV